MMDMVLRRHCYMFNEKWKHKAWKEPVVVIASSLSAHFWVMCRTLDISLVKCNKLGDLGT